MNGSVGSTTASGTGSSLHSQSIPAEIIIPIVLNSCDVLLEEKERVKWLPHVSALDILNDLTAYLWYGLHPLRPESNGDDAFPATILREDRLHRTASFLPFLPIAVQIENVQYFLGKLDYRRCDESSFIDVVLSDVDGCIPLPSEDKPKKFPIICESNPAVIELLRRLQQWVLTPSSSSTTTTESGTQNDLRYRLTHERWMKQDLLVRNIHVIRYVAQRLREAFSQFQQAADGTHRVTPVVEVDSSATTLSFDQRHVFSVEKLQLWRNLVSEAMVILYESFALYQEHCIFRYRHPFSWAVNQGISGHHWLPFQLFSHVQCSSGAMTSCISLPLTMPMTGLHRSIWKLQTLSLHEDAGVFEYLLFRYSTIVERWREAVTNSGIMNGDAVFTSLCRPRVVSTSENVGPCCLSAEEWSQLLKGCRPLPRQLLTEDPWLSFCAQIGKVSPSFRQLRVPSAYLMAPTTPQLALLVCFLGVVTFIDSRRPANAGSCEILMDDQLLREFPDVIPSVSDFLCSLSATDLTQVSVRYTERGLDPVDRGLHSNLPLIPYRL